MAAHFKLSVDMFRILERIQPGFNIAPSQPVAIVREDAHSLHRELTHVHWGLIPGWAKDVSVGNRMINARSETAAVKQGYRGAMKYRRCLIPATGFYEWQKLIDGKTRQAMYIHRQFNREDGAGSADGDDVESELFALAGLWEHWQGPGGEEVESCTVLTTQPNELMKPIHDRMPVILRPADYARWLSTKVQDGDAVVDLLRPCDAEGWQARPVSSYVNSPRNDGPRCTKEVGRQGGLFE